MWWRSWESRDGESQARHSGEGEGKRTIEFCSPVDNVDTVDKDVVPLLIRLTPPRGWRSSTRPEARIFRLALLDHVSGKEIAPG